MPIPPMRHSSTPRWVYIAGGAVVLVGGFLWYRNKQNANSTGASSTNSATAPTLESTGYTSGVTDTSNNLPYEDTWPYNQLALPYNYNGSASALVNANTTDVMPFTADQTVVSPVGS